MQCIANETGAERFINKMMALLPIHSSRNTCTVRGKKEKRKREKSLQHPVFPGGHPSKY